MDAFPLQGPGVRAIVAVVCVLATTGAARAQDLEPKAYSASPVGAAFLVVGLGRSTGSVLTDPTLPLTDVEAKMNGVPIAAGYTFGLFGKLALITAALPVSWGDVSGLVGEEARVVTRSGLADTRAKLSVNLVGNPALGLRDYSKAPRRTIVGTSLTVVSPTGQYRRREVDQPRDQPLGVQARGRGRGAKRALGLRRVSRRLALHEQRRFLPGGPNTVAGSCSRAPGPRELHVPAASVGGCRCDVVSGGRRECRRR